jgi:Rieske Fe-S protein
MNPRPNTGSPLPGLSRRSVLGVTVAGAAGLLTAACGGGGSSGTTGTSSGDTTTPSAAGSSTGSSSSGGGGSNGLVKTAKVPVGEGVILADQKIVVTQPTAGQFKGFSAICTHMNCTVGSIQGGTIMCPCHGSQYSIKDGSVTGGPAPKPLSKIAVKVVGDEVVKA